MTDFQSQQKNAGAKALANEIGNHPGPHSVSFVFTEGQRKTMVAALSAPAASTGEPVAWQCRFNVGGWLEWKQVDQPIEVFRKKAKHNIDIGSCEIRPVYAAPASGDVRAAVIEALAFYAEPTNWQSPSSGFALQYDPEPSPINRDRGSKAAAALSQAPATDAGRHLEYHSRFLLDRLQEFDPGDFEAEREFHGHVAPAIARLRSALGVA